MGKGRKYRIYVESRGEERVKGIFTGVHVKRKLKVFVEDRLIGDEEGTLKGVCGVSRDRGRDSQVDVKGVLPRGCEGWTETCGWQTASVCMWMAD